MDWVFRILFIKFYEKIIYVHDIGIKNIFTKLKEFISKLKKREID